MKVVPQNESVGAANHTRGFQFSRNPSGGVTGMQKHKRLPRRRHRLQQCPSQPSPAAEADKQKQYENDTHLASLDEC